MGELRRKRQPGAESPAEIVDASMDGIDVKKHAAGQPLHPEERSGRSTVSVGPFPITATVIQKVVNAEQFDDN